MKQRIRTFVQDPFIRNNAVYFFGSLFVAALNYLYHPVLSRFLSLESFGDLETLLVVYGQISIVLGVFGKIAINSFVHRNTDAGEQDAELVMLRELYTLAVAVIGGIALIILAFSVPLLHTFHFDSIYSVLLLGILVLLSIPTTFQTAVIQGKRDFAAASISAAITAGGKLAFALVFALLGFGITGAILALAIAQLASVGYMYVKTRTEFSLRLTHLPHRALFRKEVPYALLVLISGVTITMLYNSDIAVVKYLFSPDVAGLYSGISVIDNALFFITASIAGVLLPSISRHASFAENNRNLIKGVGLTTLIGGSVLTMFATEPSIVIRGMIGAKYLPFSHYLPILAFLIFLVSLSNIFISYFLALRNYILIPISLIVTATLTVSLYVRHNLITEIIQSYLLASIVMLFLLIGFYGYHWRNESHKYGDKRQ